VKDLYSHPQLYDMPVYSQAVASYQSDLKSLITEVLMTLTPEQKKKLKKNLAEKTAQLEKVQASIL
jgi:Spy/CpxP family protein refolding chaperone